LLWALWLTCCCFTSIAILVKVSSLPKFEGVVKQRLKALFRTTLTVCLKAYPDTKQCLTKKPLAYARGFFWGRDLGEAPFGPERDLIPAYFGWSIVGAEELLDSCSRSFFRRLISTRPPLMCLVFES
jgi:hypothetical protein